jgi:ParB-like chromosome segregation protein Spo0J
MAKEKPEMKWPIDKIERRKLSTLIPYAQNSRIHSPEQISQIAASIKEWGWTSPIVIDETGMIIAGHGRVLAAQSLGLLEAPCAIAEGWSEEQKKAYCLVDNKISDNSEFDNSKLFSEVKLLLDNDIIRNVFSDLVLPDLGDEKPKTEVLTPYRLYHVLISVPMDRYDSIKAMVEQIEKVSGVEVEYGAN